MKAFTPNELKFFHGTMMRQIFHSKFDGDAWIVKLDKAVISRHTTQAGSEVAATKAGKKVKRLGGLGRAVLHRRDGSVHGERNYGLDRQRFRISRS